MHYLAFKKVKRAIEKNTTQKGHLRRTSILSMIGQVGNLKKCRLEEGANYKGIWRETSLRKKSKFKDPESGVYMVFFYISKKNSMTIEE